MKLLCQFTCIFSLFILSALFSTNVSIENSKDSNNNVYDNDFWAIIVASSRYWFNYRHSANAVSVYKTMKDLGISDSHIIFMNAIDFSIDSRNNKPGYVMFNSNYKYTNDNIDNYLFSMDDVQIDYYDEQVNVQAFTRLLTGRVTNHMNSRLDSHKNSSILIYLTGHGGDEFFKFQDNEELSAQELAHAFQEMYVMDRYKEIILILDTCQASTMSNYITSSNIFTLASSSKGENSYAYSTNEFLGIATSDRFTYSMYTTMHHYIKYKQSKYKYITLYDLYKSFNNQILHSTAHIHKSMNSIRDFKDIRLFDFIHPHSNIVTTSLTTTTTTTTSNRRHNSIDSSSAIQSIQHSNHYRYNDVNHDIINALWTDIVLQT